MIVRVPSAGRVNCSSIGELACTTSVCPVSGYDVVRFATAQAEQVSCTVVASLKVSATTGRNAGLLLARDAT